MKTVLVVDEDKETLEYVRDLLKGSDYAGLFATDGATALRLAESSPGLDLLLAALPAMPDSAEAFAVSLAAASPGLRTVFMSGHPLRLLERNGIRVDGDSFLQKPFTRVRLLEVLDGALEEAEVAVGAEAAEAATELDQAA
jgi:CheY-like chemotaxis protein